MPDQLSRLRERLAGRYEVENEIGRGGMAAVYRAQDIQHARPIALKVLHPELAASLGGERFQREIRLAAGLQHPHILSVYDSGDADGVLWFAMPFVEGESLRDRLDRERQLPIADAVRIAREVALALDFAHRHNVIHRDIKPENILLIDGQALVADFGIARALTGGRDSLTSTGMSLGTPAYMSPEQAAGDKTIDQRSDIYSLGCVLYEMLTGEPAFSGSTAQAVIADVITGTPKPVVARRGTVSPSLARVVEQALAKSPADRPPTAAQFAQMLEAASAAPATAATGGTHTWRWIAVAAAAVLVIGAFVAMRVRGAGASSARRIAVLPFENAGAADDEYFADGMTDEVRSRLSTIRGLRVTARASSSQYRRTNKTPRDIGRELDVQYLLTGTVRWSKSNGVNRVRVTPELIDVSNASSKWSAPYDTVMSDVFSVQANIASQVAEALDVALAAPEREQIARPSSTSLDAYDEFLKGEQITNALATSDLDAISKGLDHYNRAVQLDSNFMRAWAQIARGQSSINNTRPSRESADSARIAAERAVQLAPNRAESRLAMGQYLVRVKLDYAGAYDQLEQALQHDPNNPDVLSALASVEESLGKWDDMVAHAKQSAAVDPRSVVGARRLATAYHDTRRYAEELPAWDKALALAPTNLSIIQGKAFGYMSLGQLDSVHALVHEKLKVVDTTALLVRFALYQETMWALPPELWPKILKLSAADFGNDRGHWGLKLGHTYLLLGDTVHGRQFGDSARLAFEAQLKDFPERAQLHELRGRALALNGRKKEAIEEAERSLALRETTLDASLRPYVHFQVARILVQSGEFNRALDLLEPLLTSNASDVTPAYLKIDPTFAPLAGNERFQRMIARK